MVDFQANVLAEVMAVVDAKGIALPNPDISMSMPKKSRNSFNRPSMLQHVEMGRKTEIDSLNGALLREAEALGIATPYNEALVALLKGREYAQIQAVHGPRSIMTPGRRGSTPVRTTKAPTSAISASTSVVRRRSGRSPSPG